MTYELIGNTKAPQGDLAGAMAAYEESRKVRERLAAADPGNAGGSVVVGIDIGLARAQAPVE